MMWKLTFAILLGLVYRTVAQEGEGCNQDGVPGTCTLLSRCESAKSSRMQWWKLNRCGFVDLEPIVCCVRVPTTSTTTTTTTSTTTTRRPAATTPSVGSRTTEYEPPDYEYVTNEPQVTGCRPVAVNLTTPKTGRKAYDKCIEYQEQLVYPCKRSTVLLNDMTRGNECKHNADALVVGGVDALRDEFPHMVLLGYTQVNGSTVWQCGGTLLSDRFILTAGHCTSARDVGPVAFAIVGTLKRTDDVSATQVHRIQRIIRHPNYKAPSKYNDIALLETATKITLDSSTVPACLDVFGGDRSKAVATGWGAVGWRAGNADTLQKVTLTRFTDEECRVKYRSNRYLVDGFDSRTQVCYGDYTKAADTCQGDSGGPLTIKNSKVHCMYTVVGITSYGKACGFAGDPGMYTKLEPYVSWIEDTVWG